MGLSLSDLRYRAEILGEIFNTLLTDEAYNKLHEDVKQQLATGINNAFGQAQGFLQEFLTTRQALAKKREVWTQLHGDVTVGHADELFAKTVECKSVTAPTKSAANDQILKALSQLGGDTGHMPREGDVRVADIRIAWRDNRWPFTDQGHRDYGVSRESQFVDENEVLRLMKEEFVRLFAKDEAKSLRAWVLGETVDTRGARHASAVAATNQFGQPVQPFPNSTRPVVQVTAPVMQQTPFGPRQVWQNTPSGPQPVMQTILHKVRCVTIKIRYEPAGWVLGLFPDGVHELTQVVTQVYKGPTGSLNFETAKVRYCVTPV